jgi:tetratricopeptide (TPR) repeat protein
MPKPLSVLLLPTLLLSIAASAFAQAPSGGTPGGPPEPPRGAAREQMWPAPTQEDWEKPCLITFQRTWEDALAVAKETRRPILVCINMDGEIASEHYAGVRYRSPEIAKLYEPYVCVIASVYRHTPRDYDDQGRRILCPRFGSVTCGEHIAIEPGLFEKFMDGRRIAPRHIMVEVDGKETYDVYYRNDTASVFADIRKGIDERKIEPRKIVRGDRSITERVASRDIHDRMAVEAAWESGDEAQRKAILDAAAKLGGDAPVDLLRLAIFGLDVDLSKEARDALAASDSTKATDLITDALRVPMDDSERDALIAALGRIGEKSPRARWMASVYSGLTGESKAVDLEGWSKVSVEEAASRPVVVRKIEDLTDAQEASVGSYQASPGDPVAAIGRAEASLALALRARKRGAVDPRSSQALARHMFADARYAAQKAGKLGAEDWRTNTVLCLVDYYRGDKDSSYGYAERAVREMPPGRTDWNSMAVLTIFAEGRFMSLKQKVKAKEDWPTEWLTDLDAAYSALVHHPLSTVGQVEWHYDTMLWLGAKDRALRVLEQGLERFPESPVLHGNLRMSILRERGAGELESTYDRMLEEHPDSPILSWYAGYATVVVADFHRRRRRVDDALTDYDRAIALYEKAMKGDPKLKPSADRAIALVLAGRARIAYQKNDDRRAVDEILASFKRSPESAGTRDGMGITPGETGQMILSRLREERRTVLAQRLAQALSALDPALLRPDIGLEEPK